MNPNNIIETILDLWGWEDDTDEDIADEETD
jgi:hypothetical protein